MYSEVSDPKNWGLTLDYYKNGNWGSIKNGKAKIEWNIKQHYIEVNQNGEKFFNEEKFYDNTIRTWINAFMFNKKQYFDLIRPWNLSEELLEKARVIINIAFEEAVLNNNLYQISKAQVFQSAMGTVNSQSTSWNNQLDLFGERSKSLLGTWGSDLKIVEIEVDDDTNVNQEIQKWFKNSKGLLEPISSLSEEDFPKNEGAHNG